MAVAFPDGIAVGDFVLDLSDVKGMHADPGRPTRIDVSRHDSDHIVALVGTGGDGPKVYMTVVGESARRLAGRYLEAIEGTRVADITAAMDLVEVAEALRALRVRP